MKVDGKQIRPIWLDNDNVVNVIDQRKLPHALEVMTLTSVDEVIYAIQEMVVRGAPLIGVTGAYGVVVALETTTDQDMFRKACQRIKDSRPTAVNLAWAVERMLDNISYQNPAQERLAQAREQAGRIAGLEVDNCRRIGEHGAKLIADISKRKNNAAVNILTHCNAGWLACIEYGTATAPIYMAHKMGIDVHVWVDETRPLNQGARLTAWELGKQTVKHTLITDNAGGYLMQKKMVDMVIVGTDRSTYTGDVANKIGTYLKALAARDNDLPFYVALPSSTFDWQLTDGLKQIPIEERDPDEVRYIHGLAKTGVEKVLLTAKDSPALNPAFDITPAHLVTGFITERGICPANETAIVELFPEKR
ncbi:MAG: S-methyl-5-thioribose-1-phosphate isomerase [Desulfobacteraceae bacterium]|nr:S-methyl-5-thioribose-1-phosphate isomerase [Desulfobacteraceae bacterium]